MLVGIDMGGTHIDGVVLKDKKIIKRVKNNVDKNNLYNTIWTTIQELIKDLNKKEISRINLSTTVSTNALVEGKESKVGLILISGPGRLYDFSNLSENVEFLSGYVDHRGSIVKDIDLNKVKEVKKRFKAKGIKSVALVSKFSNRNPSFEKRIYEKLKNDFDHITMGHSLSGKLNFIRRVNTAYLNAAVHSVFSNFVDNILKSLKLENIEASVYILKADAGTMTIKEAKAKPNESILSGPAASLLGMQALFKEKEDAILLDIGGTTTDIFLLAKGSPLFEATGIEIDKKKTLIRAIYSKSIGIGGDSSISYKDNTIKIGPQRKDKPMVFGGKYLSPTDAMAILGYIEVKDLSKAITAMQKLADKFNVDYKVMSKIILEEFARIIYKEVDKTINMINQKPVYTIEDLLEGYQLKPQFLRIIGGPAKILKPYLEEQFTLDAKFPKDYQIANAIGAALAKPTVAINLHADTERKILTVSEMNIYKNITANYNLEKAKKKALDLVEDYGKNLYTDKVKMESEIIEANSFNMVKGYLGAFRNIRVQAQIKPGLIYDLKDDFNE